MDVLTGDEDTTTPKKLYRNDGFGIFSVVTTSGLSEVAGASNTVAFADLNADGYLDVVSGSKSGVNEAYLNSGGEALTKVAGGSYAENGASTFVAAFGDYDGDVQAHAAKPVSFLELRFTQHTAQQHPCLL